MTTTPIHDELAASPATFDAPEVGVAEDAERIVGLAWREAADLGHRHFGTGHLLLGVLRADGPEAGLLAAAGVTAQSASAAMDLVARHSASEPIEGASVVPPGPGPAIAEVLADGAWAAVADGRAAVGAPELLGALLRRPWGQAAEMLAALGVPVDDLADAARALAMSPSTAMTTAPAARPSIWRDPSRLLTSAHRPASTEQEPEPV